MAQPPAAGVRVSSERADERRIDLEKEVVNVLPLDLVTHGCPNHI
jgi:hypothetical protein